MITTLVASTLLLLAPASDFYDEPIALDIGLPPPCTEDAGCANPDTPLCNVETGECVECLGPEHCPEGWGCGPTGFCRDACEVDGDCEGISGQTLCNPETGFCVQCVDASNCVPEEYCDEEGFCRFDLCDVDQTTACSSGMIVECTADGGPGSVLDICAEGCEVVDGMAQCVMTGGSSGGSADGTAGGSAGMGSDEAEGGGAGTTMGASAGTEASGASGATAVDATDDDEGCACRADAPAGSAGVWSWWLVVGLGLARRRRR
jgi:MYXO-CTERM domain-containing protein